jgi:hypothetical protein
LCCDHVVVVAGVVVKMALTFCSSDWQQQQQQQQGPLYKGQHTHTSEGAVLAMQPTMTPYY